MRAFYFLLFTIPAFAFGQTVTVEAVPGLSGFSQVRTVTVQPNGASVAEVSRPLSDAELKADLLARFRAVSGEIAIYETALVKARQSSAELQTAVEAIAGPIENEFVTILESLAGTWVLVGPVGKEEIEIGKTGEFAGKGQIKMLSAKSFLVSGYFEKAVFFGLFDVATDVVFYQESEQIWRAKSELEIILIK